MSQIHLKSKNGVSTVPEVFELSLAIFLSLLGTND